MSVIIRLQNLPLTANSIDIRNFFRGLSIPDGGVHIVGGAEGDAFIAFSTDEDARQGMQLSGTCLKDAPVKLLLSSRNEMYKVIEQARQQALGNMPGSSSGNSPGESSNSGSTNLQQNSASVSSVMNANVVGLPLGIPPPSTSMLPLSMGFPISGGAPNSSLQQFQTLSGSLGPGSMPNFAGIMGGQPGSNFPGIFGTHPPPVVQNVGVSNMPLRASQSNQNPFSFPTGSGTDLPINYPQSIQSNSLGNNAGSVPGIQSLPNPTFLSMSSMGANGNQQYGSGGGTQRVPMLNTGSNISQYNLPNNTPQGLPMSSMLVGNVSSNLGGGTLTPGTMGIRPSFNGTQALPSSGPPKRPEERSPSNYHGMGKSSIGSGPNLNQPPFSGGRAEIRGRDRDRNERRRSQSRSKERKEARPRRRSRSRDRSRERRRERRSTSRSRSRERDRTRSRRTSRERRDERRRSDASISSPDKSTVQGRRDLGASNGNKYDQDSERGGRGGDGSVEVVTIPDDNYPCAKLMGIHNDASYREIREFIRVDVEGGGEGVVRNYGKGLAFVKLSKPEEYGKLMRQNGQKLRGVVIKIEGVSPTVWQNEYKASKRQSERSDREKDERDHRDRDRGDRGDRPRTSRFNGGASQSSCISIRGLPTGITLRDLTSNFFRDINIVDIAVVPQLSSSGRSTFTAYIQLDSPASAQKSVDVIVKSSEGSSYVVEFCEPEDILQAKRDFNIPCARDSGATSVVIADVPAHASEKDILDFFSDIGLTPQNVRRYDGPGMSDNKIVVEFNDANKARRATSKDGTLFGRNAVVSVSLWSTRSNSNSSGMNHVNSSSQQINPFNIRGGRPALLGPRPNIPNAGNRFSSISSQNPFQQALNMSASNPMMNASIRNRGPMGERPSRFPNSMNVGGGDDREGRSNYGSDRLEDMSIFEKPGCVVALENVPYKANMDDILNFLQEKLRVEIARNRIIRRFDDNQKPTGDARVAFQTPFEAKVACQRLHGLYMWKRPINVSVLSHNSF